MSEDSQIVVPPAFVALFVEPGRVKPSASREHIAARHEFCEDLAQMLAEQAATKRWELGVTEVDVLERMHRGLRAGATEPDAPGAAGVSAAEARWVIGRLAELLDWPQPGPG